METRVMHAEHAYVYAEPYKTKTRFHSTSANTHCCKSLGKCFRCCRLLL